MYEFSKYRHKYRVLPTLQTIFLNFIFLITYPKQLEDSRELGGQLILVKTLIGLRGNRMLMKHTFRPVSEAFPGREAVSSTEGGER